MSQSKVPAVAYGLEAEYIECPYNKAHQILPNRMQVHLVRCRRSYPNEKKIQCPFNATHVVGQCELEYHTANCSDQKTLISQLIEYDSQEKLFEPPPIVNIEVESTESWDDINVPTYDPTEHLENNIIIRNKQGCPPSERKAFRERERRRIEALKEQQRVGRKENSYSTNESKLTTFRRPNTVSVIKKCTTAANQEYNGKRNQTNITSTAKSSEESSQSDIEVTNRMSNLSLKDDNDEFFTVLYKKSNSKARGRGKSIPVKN